ncbi:LysR family transcriptional regulator [Sphingobium sp.]|uniref:LysR family transcriptional regulator n=1 Tax=Sphingobium sp. TaxID=1912891 RepID=UPI003B3ADBFE
MPHDRIEGLTVFVRVVETGSFSNAARLLNITPSAISRSIARLEKRLSTRLFQRSTRSIDLTHAGEAYFERISPVLREIEAADAEIGCIRTMRGRVRLSLPCEIAPPLLDRITTAFVPLFPQLQLEVSINDRHGHGDHNVDLAIRAGPVESAGLHEHDLGQMTPIMVAAPAYLDRMGRPATPDDLQAHDHLSHGGCDLPQAIDLADGSRLQLPRAGFSAHDWGTLLIAARNGLGIARMMHWAIRDDLGAGRLVQLLPDVRMRSLPLRAYHAHGRSVPQRIGVLLNFIEEQVRESEMARHDRRSG